KKEKERIFREETLQQSIEGKDPLEQARIISNYNRQKAKQLNKKKEEK
ncbi:MAG: hypothetical protein HUJ59_02215, partial [Bacilli bacterium]|nr:hypothetical protein [Bacilli bacterium]